MQVAFTDVDGAVAAVVSVVTVVVVERPDGKSRMSDGDEGIRNLLLSASTGSIITVEGTKSLAGITNTPTRMVVPDLWSFVAEWVAAVDPNMLLTSPPKQRVTFFAAKLLDVIPEPIAAETTLQTLQAQQADLIARMDAAEKVQALQDEEATKVRELCSLSRRQDYFDVPLSVLVQCQLRQERVDRMSADASMIQELRTLIDVDGPLNAWRNIGK